MHVHHDRVRLAAIALELTHPQIQLAGHHRLPAGQL